MRSILVSLTDTCLTRIEHWIHVGTLKFKVSFEFNDIR